MTTFEREILQILNSLDCNKSTCPDEIPVKFLKLNAIITAELLSKLFNMSSSSEIYRSKLTRAVARLLEGRAMAGGGGWISASTSISETKNDRKLR